MAVGLRVVAMLADALLGNGEGRGQSAALTMSLPRAHAQCVVHQWGGWVGGLRSSAYRRIARLSLAG